MSDADDGEIEIASDAPDPTDVFQAFNTGEESKRDVARNIINTEGRRRLGNEIHQYTQQPGLKFKAEPDEIADGLMYGIESVEMYMHENQPGLLCIDIVSTTIDTGLVEHPNDSKPAPPPSFERSVFTKVSAEIFGRFSASTCMFDMAVSVAKDPELTVDGPPTEPNL